MPHLRIILKNHTNPAYGGALVGAQAVAARLGATVDHVAPQTPDDVAQQNALIDQAIAERPDAIVLLPTHATGVNGAIARVNAAGIPLVLMVSEPTGGAWVGYVGTDSERMAADLGDAVLQVLPGDAHVAFIDGHPGSITTPERRRGFEQALARRPGMRLVGSVSGDYQQEPARRAAMGLLQGQPRVDALLVANDLMAMGVLQALDELGRRAVVASINGTPDAVAQVRRGRLHATASFNTHRFGCLAVEMAVRHLRGETVPRRIVLAPDIIDAGNAAAWDIPYEKRAAPAWETFAAMSEETVAVR